MASRDDAALGEAEEMADSVPAAPPEEGLAAWSGGG